MALKKKATDEARLGMLQSSSPLFHHSNQGAGISGEVPSEVPIRSTRA